MDALFFLGLDGILLFSRSQKNGVRRSRPQPRKFTILALHPALLSSPFSGGKSAASVPERSLSGVVGPFTDYASFEQALRNLTGEYGSCRQVVQAAAVSGFI